MRIRAACVGRSYFFVPGRSGAEPGEQVAQDVVERNEFLADAGRRRVGADQLVHQHGKLIDAVVVAAGAGGDLAMSLGLAASLSISSAGSDDAELELLFAQLLGVLGRGQLDDVVALVGIGEGYLIQTGAGFGAGEGNFSPRA